MNKEELKKKLKLPMSKDIVYWDKGKKYIVSDIEIADIYQPSGTISLWITLETGERVRILGPYLSEMQSSSFGKK